MRRGVVFFFQHLRRCVLLLLHAGAFGDDELVAALVDHTGAHCRGGNTHTQGSATHARAHTRCLESGGAWRPVVVTLALVALLPQDAPEGREKATRGRGQRDEERNNMCLVLII